MHEANTGMLAVSRKLGYFSVRQLVYCVQRSPHHDTPALLSQADENIIEYIILVAHDTPMGPNLSRYVSGTTCTFLMSVQQAHCSCQHTIAKAVESTQAPTNHGSWPGGSS